MSARLREHTHSQMRSNHELTVQAIPGIHCRVDKSAKCYNRGRPKSCGFWMQVVNACLQLKEAACSGGKVVRLMSAGADMPQRSIS